MKKNRLSMNLIMVLAMAAVAVADDKSPAGADGSWRSAQKMPYIQPSSCAVRRIS